MTDDGRMCKFYTTMIASFADSKYSVLTAELGKTIRFIIPLLVVFVSACNRVC